MGVGSISIGCGSADAAERIDWPVELANSGLVSYMGFDALAERTLAFAHARKMANPHLGYNEHLPRTIPGFAPFVAGGGKIATNQGGANPDAAGRLIVDELRRLGYSGIKVGIISGDDCLETVLAQDIQLPEIGSSVRELGPRLVGAYAYIGAEPVVECLEQGADWVIGGRLADPSCYVGPVCHELGWDLDDWHHVGIATAAGHLLECGQHVTGGNFNDPGKRMFSGMERLGFPYATIEQDGSIVVSKLPGTGGGVTRDTVIAQLTYEVHDPARYLTPDVTANFQDAEVEDLGDDRVRVTGITGTERPDMLKVLVGVDWGYRVIGFTNLGGPNCLARARMVEEVLRKRFEQYGDAIHAVHFGYIGYNALYGDAYTTQEPAEVQLRAAVLVRDKEVADAVAEEVGKQAVWITVGQGGTGLLQNSRHVAPTPIYLPREQFKLSTEIVTV
jgi:Acyclic terpene utilisation family protein AtuA